MDSVNEGAQYSSLRQTGKASGRISEDGQLSRRGTKRTRLLCPTGSMFWGKNMTLTRGVGRGGGCWASRDALCRTPSVCNLFSEQAGQRHCVIDIFGKVLLAASVREREREGQNQIFFVVGRNPGERGRVCMKAVETEGDDRIISFNPPHTPRG